MIRPVAVRLTGTVPSRSIVARQTPFLRDTPRQQPLQSLRVRRYATEPPPPPPPPSGGGGGGDQMYIVLGAILALGVGGYYFLKPVRDVAATTHQVMNTVRDQASGLGEGAASISGIAQSFLPPGALALYTQLSKQEGGINGFLTALKDKDLQGVMDEVKKVGGDDVKRVIEKVEKKVKDAGGKVQKVDWGSLAQELKEELPKDKQHYVDLMIGKLPSKADLDGMIKQAKEVGEDQLKQVEKAASKILAEVNKAKKEGKGQVDALIAGLNSSRAVDIDDLVRKLQDAARKAGLPAGDADRFLKHKTDGTFDGAGLGKLIEEKLRSVSQYIPGDPKDIIDQVKQISPSVAELLLHAFEQAGITDAKGNRK